MTDFELGWVIGLLEGEGSFNLRLNRQTRIAVAQADNALDVLEKLKQFTDMGNIHGPYDYSTKRKGKPYYIWAIGDYKNCKTLIDKVYPHLSHKRKVQCDKLINYLKDKEIDF